MIRRLVQILIVTALTLGLSACFVHRSMAPLPDETKAELVSRGLKIGAPLYVRVFKLENEMEVWLKNPTGSYTLFRTYPICNWSGKLGPKLKEGDKQAPEGFYVVNAGQMNPNSKYYLSFNMGYPNAYDKAHERTGKHLMVHGGCSSAGCYAITDDAVTELFILAREAFTGGQRHFPIAAFPFRPTKQQLEQSKDHKWHAFWLNLKEGYDLFESTRRPPVAAVQDGRYMFYADMQSVPAELRENPGVQDAQNPGGFQLISGWKH